MPEAGPVTTFAAFLRAFARGYTYDVRRNSYLLDPADRASAARLLERAEGEVRKGTGLSLSAGIACWPEDGQTPDELIDAADRRLGACKRKSQESRTLPRLRLVADDGVAAGPGRRAAGGTDS